MSFRLMVESHNLHKMSLDIVQAGYQTSKCCTKCSMIMLRHVYKPKEHVLKRVAVFFVLRYSTLVTLINEKKFPKLQFRPQDCF